MIKYLGIFKTAIKQERKTLQNTIMALFSFCVIILIFNQLWKYIYTNGSANLIKGYTLDMMLWYLIMSEILSYSISPRKLTRAFATDIKTGKIAYSLNKPYNYFMYQITSTFASSVWKILFMIPTGLIVGYILVGNLNGFKFYYLFPVVLVILLSLLLGIIVYGIVGLFAFWIEEPSPFTWIIQKFILLFGVFFPPEFFPEILQPFILYSPIYAMMSGPCMLLSNYSNELFLKVFISQIIYLGLFSIIGLIVYKIGAKKVNINGG